MRFIAILASAFAAILTMVWLINSPGYDSAGACAAAVAALFSSFLSTRGRKSDGQTQQVSDSSFAIQAGRDAKLRNVKNKQGT